MKPGKTHTPSKNLSGMAQGSGANKRDSAVANASRGGKTMKYKSGDVTRSTGSLKKYA